MYERPAVALAQVSALIAGVCPGWRAVRTWPLAGGVSAQVSGVELERPGGGQLRLVLRQYGAANLRADPHAAVTEYRLLELLHRLGLPVPRPVHADESGTIVPGPCLLIEYIDGERVDNPGDLTGFIRQLAGALAALHETGITRSEVPFLADASDHITAWLGTGPAGAGELGNEAAIRGALAGNWPPPRLNAAAVLHGDYWPGNMLWRDGQLVGIVDWEDALFGDPLADLAVARLEIGWFFGGEAMDMLTAQYLACRPAVDVSALPVWDLRAALRACAFPLSTWGLRADQVAAMRAAHDEFAASAIGQLAGRRRGADTAGAQR
jgi:aminoglycoside phosphotransferase (APT) family kinase protein